MKTYPQLAGQDYASVPRGRVLYVEGQKNFRIITSKAIANDRAVIAKVMRYFSLPLRTVVMSDPHYENDFDLDLDD